ncbi:VWA domain-containing protein [Streptomyces sp. NPDC005227]|uniref:VWA domain-containing protein n=1 Tax=Streptomyces sp. NPDC005227 TaxID=3364707 RepID=UPI0036934CD1
MHNPFKKTPQAPTAVATVPVEPLVAVPAGLVSLAKTAGVSLTKAGVPAGLRAAVYLVIDRSLSMADYFDNGSVQRLADQALGLSVNLDDDGTVPLVFFDNRPYPVVDISLDRYEGVVAAQHQLHGGERSMGGTHYTAAMNTVIDHYRISGATDPALVVFQTDGAPQDKDAARHQLAQASKMPIFWAFVGFGPTKVPFLKELDKLRGRLVDNASYFHAGANPHGVPDSELYDGITSEFGSWLPAARAKGLLP